MPIQFLRPDLAPWLLLLPVVIVGWLAFRRGKLRFRRAAGLGPAMQSLSRLSSKAADYSVLVSGLVVVLAVVLAAMRPQMQMDRVVPEYARQDLILILDRSASMQARDVPPSRFARAIEEIKSFLAEKPAEIDRVGLVGFAGTALTLSHLGRDLETLFFFLDWIGDDPELYFGTDLAAALTNAIELVNKDEALDREDEPAQKVFLLLSDGDDQSEKLVAMLNQLQQRGIRVHSIGIGSDAEVPIPIGEGGGEIEYLEDEEGRQLTTQFHESTLRMVADMTGGRYFRSTTGHELAGFIGDIVESEKRQIGLRRSGEMLELHLPLLMLATVALSILLVKL